MQTYNNINQLTISTSRSNDLIVAILKIADSLELTPGWSTSGKLSSVFLGIMTSSGVCVNYGYQPTEKPCYDFSKVRIKKTKEMLSGATLAVVMVNKVPYEILYVKTNGYYNFHAMAGEIILSFDEESAKKIYADVIGVQYTYGFLGALVSAKRLLHADTNIPIPSNLNDTWSPMVEVGKAYYSPKERCFFWAEDDMVRFELI